MIIKLEKFGDVLTSRDDGREAYKAIQPEINSRSKEEKIILDFTGVFSLSPSWADEFVTNLKKDYGDKLELKNLSNPSVKETLKMLEKIEDLGLI
ncbi:MAG: DUF4325 domain-containing protein [Patescibacteria group bacterium]|nr:DUF4325 domain-containing protein [Patescibacteria group bacterium]